MRDAVEQEIVDVYLSPTGAKHGQPIPAVYVWHLLGELALARAGLLAKQRPVPQRAPHVKDCPCGVRFRTWKFLGVLCPTCYKAAYAKGNEKKRKRIA